ncbi:hypothetical protein ACA910_011932 [Epithemia clementina (nom. ined.)]
MQRLQDQMKELRSAVTSQLHSLQQVRQSLRVLDEHECQALQQRAQVLQRLLTDYPNHNLNDSIRTLKEEEEAEQVTDIWSSGNNSEDTRNPTTTTTTTTIHRPRETRLCRVDIPQVPPFAMESYDVYQQQQQPQQQQGEKQPEQELIIINQVNNHNHLNMQHGSSSSSSSEIQFSGPHHGPDQDHNHDDDDDDNNNNSLPATRTNRSETNHISTAPWDYWLCGTTAAATTTTTGSTNPAALVAGLS